MIKIMKTFILYNSRYKFCQDFKDSNNQNMFRSNWPFSIDSEDIGPILFFFTLTCICTSFLNSLEFWPSIIVIFCVQCQYALQVFPPYWTVYYIYCILFVWMVSLTWYSCLHGLSLYVVSAQFQRLFWNCISHKKIVPSFQLFVYLEVEYEMLSCDC